MHYHKRTVFVNPLDKNDIINIKTFKMLYRKRWMVSIRGDSCGGTILVGCDLKDTISTPNISTFYGCIRNSDKVKVETQVNDEETRKGSNFNI